MADQRLALDDGSLVDVLERLVCTGVVADGTVLLTLAGVDLARLDLRLMLASMAGRSAGLGDGPWIPAPPARRQAPSVRDDPGPANPRAGLAGLVLAVVDLVRRLLERLALARMEAGELSAAEVERLGRALMSLEQQVEALAEVVGVRSMTTRRSMT